MGFSSLFYTRRKEFFIHIPTAYCNENKIKRIIKINIDMDHIP
jgi:hypothetical protein